MYVLLTDMELCILVTLRKARTKIFDCTLTDTELLESQQRYADPTALSVGLITNSMGL